MFEERYCKFEDAAWAYFFLNNERSDFLETGYFFKLITEGLTRSNTLEQTIGI